MSRASALCFPSPDGRAERSPAGALLGTWCLGGSSVWSPVNRTVTVDALSSQMVAGLVPLSQSPPPGIGFQGGILRELISYRQLVSHRLSF